MQISTDLLTRRLAAFGPNAPLFYDRPLHLVRGDGAWVWDADGTRYLDGYNNVPHVGHCHPHVVEALCRQAGRINVSTRYLHEAVLDYSERLLDLFPDPLDRAMFVCTGTEANELALRMARARSGHRGVIVTDFSYHGNSANLAELTTGLPHPEPFADHARAVPLPDPRLWRGRQDELIDHHLALVDHAIASLDAAGHGVAAVLFETVFSTEGLIAVPPRYVEEVAARARRAGGFFIADEVQAGFGRMGNAMWGFEGAGIVPDFVTLGKPMGNGHPMGAVVTRRDLADAFTGEALYFNTFGGNPVSAAVGNAMLDVLIGERLVEKAHVTGSVLQAALKELARDMPCIGDVRGRGLFAAVDIVDAKGRPDPRRCRAIVNGLRGLQVLISRIGPADNVLKIRPPLPFGAAEARLLVDALREVLTDLPESAR